MKKKIILIVDDEASQHLLLKSQLKPKGYGVLHAYSGAEALKIARDKHFDLILLDVKMPDMNGFQTLDQLHKQEGIKEIPVIFLSSLDRPYLKVKGLESGAVDYLTKPFNTAELTARIEVALRRYEKNSTEPPPGASIMQGNFESMELEELVQSMGFLGKTCTIIFYDIDGELTMKEGMALGIHQGHATGKDAFLRLLLFQQGGFTVVFDYLPDAKKEAGINIDSLLINCVSEADEVREEIEQFGSGKVQITAAGRKISMKEIKHIESYLPLPVLSLLQEMEGAIGDNLEFIHLAMIQGNLELIN